uniref:Uncharacterized protein n=1 Tax=Rhizophora mucronata TaxID=61149 RepID=A0A2P2MIS3_RHIMU
MIIHIKSWKQKKKRFIPRIPNPFGLL